MQKLTSRIALLIAFICAWGGMTSCTLFTPPQHSEFIAVTQSSLDPDTSSKVLSFKPLDTRDIIKIHQSGIEDDSIVNIIERNGRSGDLKKSDIDRLDRAKVDQAVIDAFLAARDRTKPTYSGHHHLHFDHYSSPYYYYGYRGYRPYRYYGRYSRYGYCY